MKKKLALLVGLLLVLLLIPSLVFAHTEENPFKTDLITDHGTEVFDMGDVLVWNDEESLFVKYMVTDPGTCLTSTALHIGTSFGDIPTEEDGYPLLTEFDYQTAHDPCVTEYLYTIPSDWDPGTELYVAAYASYYWSSSAVGKLNSCEDGDCWPTIEEGEAWGGGYRFPGDYPEICIAYYFKYINQGEFNKEWPDSGFLSVAYEDLPLGTGNDFDFNDWVAIIDTEATLFGTEEEPLLADISFDVTPGARGAGFDHVFHMLFPEDTFQCDGQATYTIFDGDGNIVLQETAAFDASVENDYILVQDTINALPGFLTNTIEPEGIVSHFPDINNTDPLAPLHEPYVEPEGTGRLEIEFGELCPFDLDDFDPGAEGNEHGAGLFFDPYIVVLNTREEIHSGDVRFLSVPVDWMWPEAGVPVWLAYPDVSEDGDFPERWWENFNNLVYEGRPTAVSFDQ